MLLLLVTVVWLASNNQGYVLVVRSPYRFQFSFNFLLILIVLGFLAIHFSKSAVKSVNPRLLFKICTILTAPTGKQAQEKRSAMVKRR